MPGTMDYTMTERLTMTYGGGTHNLVCKIHKNNSADHLRRSRRLDRPRPQSAAQPVILDRDGLPKPPPLRGEPSGMVVLKRPQSAQPRLGATAPKKGMTILQKEIEGHFGPALIGVSTYPYSASQRYYLEDFQASVKSSISHPYTAVTGFNIGSSPHELLRGSNFDEDKLGNEQKWLSESKRQFVPKDAYEAFLKPARGLRSEEMMFVG